MQIKNSLKKTFRHLKNKPRLLMLFSIVLIISIAYSRFVKAGIFVIIFIALAGISKIYHRVIRTPLGIDFVLYLTILTSLVYNPLLALVVAWPGLIIADTLGSRFSYTSVVSLIGLTAVVVISNIAQFPIIISFLILTIIFEMITGILYFLMGSSPQKLLVFLASHFIFNSILIFSFTGILIKLMS